MFVNRPLLPTGDTIALSAHVDAMVVVVRLNVLPLSALDDLSRVLASSPATKIGCSVFSGRTCSMSRRDWLGPLRVPSG